MVFSKTCDKNHDLFLLLYAMNPRETMKQLTFTRDKYTIPRLFQTKISFKKLKI